MYFQPVYSIRLLSVLFNAKEHYLCAEVMPFMPLFSLYSLTLPAEILLIIYFEQKQNTIRIGTTEIATPR